MLRPSPGAGCLARATVLLARDRRSLMAFPLLGVLLLTGVPTLAAGPPKASPSERSLYRAGGSLKSAAGVASGGSGLAKSAPSGTTGQAILKSAGGRGLLRVRLQSKRRRGIDVTIVLGRKKAAQAGTLSGYGVRLRGGKLQVVRVKDGVVRGAIASSRAKIKRKGVVTVLTQTVGGYLDVQVFSGNRNLGGVSVKASTGLGQIGVIFGKKHPPSVTIKSVASRRNCQGLSAIMATPQGKTRWVGVAPAELGAAKAAASNRVKVMETIAASRKRGPAVTILKTDSLGLEALSCAKISTTVSTETPWKYVDPSYRRYRSSRPKATATGFVVDRSYKSPKMVRRLLKAYASRFPTKTKLVVLGRSREGRKVYGLAVTNDIQKTNGKPSVLLNAAHHGNEPMSSEFVFDALQILLEQGHRPEVKRWLDELVVWLVPQVNPDGAYAFLETSKRTGRKNGLDHGRDGERDIFDGVDLNRNYPFRWGVHGEKGSKSNKKSVWYRGAKPASEPETRAMMALFDQEHFSASISYHVGTVAVLAPYTIPGVKNPTPNAPWVIAESLVKGLPEHPDKRTYTVRKNLYDVDGTDQDWFRATHGTTALLVEGSRTSPNRVAKRRRIVEHGRPLWQRLLNRYIDGPTLEVVVKDAAGLPVQAQVSISEKPNHNGERWYSRCRDGFHGLMLARNGTLTVVIKAPGQAPVQRKVAVAGRTRVEVALPQPATAASPCPPAIGAPKAK